MLQGKVKQAERKGGLSVWELNMIIHEKYLRWWLTCNNHSKMITFQIIFHGNLFLPGSLLQQGAHSLSVVRATTPFHQGLPRALLTRRLPSTAPASVYLCDPGCPFSRLDSTSEKCHEHLNFFGLRDYLGTKAGITGQHRAEIDQRDFHLHFRPAAFLGKLACEEFIIR